MTIEPQTAFDSDYVLYYPNIEFFSVDWLKRALAVWDRVYRIVPTSYRPSDPDEVREAVDAGLVVDIGLDEMDLAQVKDEFLEFIGEPWARPAGLVPGESTTRVHGEKIDHRLRPLMRELCTKVGADEWLELPSELANGYMLFLADVVARRRGIARFTEDADVFTAMQFFACGGDISDFVEDPDAAEMTSALTLNVMAPIGLTHAPMRTLLDFRRDTAEGRVAFRSELSKLLAELSAIEDETFARERILDRIKALRTAAESPRLLKSLGDGIASTLFTVALPTALAVYNAVPSTPQNNPFDGFRIGTSVAIAAIAALGKSGLEQRRKWRPTSANYLVGLERAFGTDHQLRPPCLSPRMEEFIND
jgi:hypothetical protein